MSEIQGRLDKQRIDALTPVETSLAILDAAAKWQRELMRFFGSRVAQYFDFSTQLSSCKNPGDVLELQAAFLQKLLSDYKMEGHLISRQFLNLENQPARTYEATILKAQQDAARIIDLAKDQAARIVDEAVARTPRQTATLRSSNHRRRKTVKG